MEEVYTGHLTWEAVPRVFIGGRVYIDQQDVLTLMCQLDDEYQDLGEWLLRVHDEQSK